MARSGWRHGSRLAPRLGKGDPEAGAGLALTALVVLVVCLIALVGLIATGYLLASHRARSTADLSALAGAQAALDDGFGSTAAATACATARRVAEGQGGRLSDCQVALLDDQVVVSVEVAQPVPRPWAGLPDQVLASAHAGNVDPESG
ncbi:MAG: flp pilus-assembly TadE/G-like family protein [Propionibacteriaceae bacterium]|jgi:secretion/DNA translocation related TadE-like protein|nr:flp pilus-assembly TadE/G-like family protein [Propionibacteriaceae bacterium]